MVIIGWMVYTINVNKRSIEKIFELGEAPLFLGK